MDVPTIMPGNEEWLEWREYFERHLRWIPYQMKMVIQDHAQAKDPTKCMTVPAKWPVHFDAAFQPHEHWSEPKPKLPPLRVKRETLEELKARFGADWGIYAVDPLERKSSGFIASKLLDQWLKDHAQ